MKNKFDVVVVSELNVDIILNRLTALTSISDEILTGERNVILGSSSAIFVANISTLGIRTTFLGKIGKDDFVKTVLESLLKKLVNTDSIFSRPEKKPGPASP